MKQDHQLWTLLGTLMATLAVSSVDAVVLEKRFFTENATQCTGAPLQISRTLIPGIQVCAADSKKGCTPPSPNVFPAFSQTQECLPSYRSPLMLVPDAITNTTDNYVALVKLTNNTQVSCAEESRVESMQFYRADGACHLFGTEYFKASCGVGAKATVSVCADKDCTNCRPETSYTVDKEGQCSNEADAPRFFLQCYGNNPFQDTPSTNGTNNTGAIPDNSTNPDGSQEGDDGNGSASLMQSWSSAGMALVMGSLVLLL